MQSRHPMNERIEDIPINHKNPAVRKRKGDDCESKVARNEKF
jgi:hypothetical protein